MVTITQLKKVNTYEDLEAIGIGNVYSDISYRGGGIGFYSNDVAAYFKVNPDFLPPKFGAGCNYLGGGIRGQIFASTFNTKITGRKKSLLYALANACVRVYKNIEDSAKMNDEEDSDGGTNWDAVATKATRDAGIKSVY
jgi:hypothetical protein